MKILITASQGSNFTGFYKKDCNFVIQWTFFLCCISIYSIYLTLGECLPYDLCLRK